MRPLYDHFRQMFAQVTNPPLDAIREELVTSLVTTIGAEQNLPAFNENLVGKTAEDEVEFSVEYPEEYQAKNLAGQKVTYKATVREVKRREVPALDDEFASRLMACVTERERPNSMMGSG